MFFTFYIFISKHLNVYMFIVYIIYDDIWTCTMNKQIHIHMLVAGPSIFFLNRGRVEKFGDCCS